MKIAIGNDELGLEYKLKIVDLLQKKGIEVVDMGTDSADKVDYPDFAAKVAQAVSDKTVDRGILICGTGIGMAICANKFKGVYAAVCHDTYSTERSILSNDANVMCLGALVIGPAAALTYVDRWVDLTFKESPSRKKIDKMRALEK